MNQPLPLQFQNHNRNDAVLIGSCFGILSLITIKVVAFFIYWPIAIIAHLALLTALYFSTQYRVETQERELIIEKKCLGISYKKIHFSFDDFHIGEEFINFYGEAGTLQVKIHEEATATWWEDYPNCVLISCNKEDIILGLPKDFNNIRDNVEQIPLPQKDFELPPLQEELLVEEVYEY